MMNLRIDASDLFAICNNLYSPEACARISNYYAELQEREPHHTVTTLDIMYTFSEVVPEDIDEEDEQMIYARLWNGNFLVLNQY